MAEPVRVAIRRAGADDAEAIARLHADSWRRHYRGVYSDAFLDGDVVNDRRSVWIDRLLNQDGTAATFLAEDGNSVCGFVHVIYDEDETFGSLIDNLHVEFRRKRSRIGTQLMSQAAAAVIERGSGGAYLWVLEQNVAAQSFYRARGGHCAERRPVSPPQGVPDLLQGSPFCLRYVWGDPSALLC